MSNVIKSIEVEFFSQNDENYRVWWDITGLTECGTPIDDDGDDMIPSGFVRINDKEQCLMYRVGWPINQFNS